MNDQFNFPSVDHLIEGVHYTIVDWSFADSAPSHTPGTPCPPRHKMTFGVCRKLGGSGDWDPEQQSDEEKKASDEATKTKSSYENNKAVSVGGKKYGWAKKNGKPVLVEWGSVAGIKKPGGGVEKKANPGEGQTVI